MLIPLKEEEWVSGSCSAKSRGRMVSLSSVTTPGLAVAEATSHVADQTFQIFSGF
jgi:hypothetical protein